MGDFRWRGVNNAKKCNFEKGGEVRKRSVILFYRGDFCGGKEGLILGGEVELLDCLIVDFEKGLGIITNNVKKYNFGKEGEV